MSIHADKPCRRSWDRPGTFVVWGRGHFDGGNWKPEVCPDTLDKALAFAAAISVHPSTPRQAAVFDVDAGRVVGWWDVGGALLAASDPSDHEHPYHLHLAGRLDPLARMRDVEPPARPHFYSGRND